MPFSMTLGPSRVFRCLLSPSVLAVLLGVATLLAGAGSTGAAAMSASRPSHAKRSGHAKRPGHALAEMSPDLAASRIGYGEAVAGNGWRGGFAFSSEAFPDSYFLGTTEKQLLVLTTTGSKLVLTPFNLVSYHRGDIKKASISGWHLTDGYVAPDDHIYVLVGRDNPAQSTSRVVTEVRQYDEDLHLLGVAKVTGGVDPMGVYDGVGASAPDMVLSGTTLIVHMSRLIFHIKGDWADHHEVNLALAVDTGTMTASDIADRPYASHSFREYVATQGDDVLFVDHGDAYPRGMQLGIMRGYLTPDHGRVWDSQDCGPTVGTPADPATGDPLDENPSDCWLDPVQDDYMTFTVPQDNAALAHHDMSSVNYTGATVNGFAVTDSQALTVGLSVPNGHNLAGVTSHSDRLMGNVYLTSTDTATGATRLVWLTNRNPRTKKCLELQPAVVAVGNGDFAVLWDEWCGEHVTMNYRLVDGTGAIFARRAWSGHAFAAVGQPTLAGGQILWVGEASTKSSYDVLNFLYGLNVTDPDHPVLLAS